MKQQIVNRVREADETKAEIADHWSRVQRRIADGRVDEAITLLKAYFRLKTKLKQIESDLQGVLGGYFSE